MTKVAINGEVEVNKADKSDKSDKSDEALSKEHILTILELLENCCIMTTPLEWTDFDNNKKVAVNIFVPHSLAEVFKVANTTCDCGILIDYFITGLVINGIKYRAQKRLEEKLADRTHPIKCTHN